MEYLDFNTNLCELLYTEVWGHNKPDHLYKLNNSLHVYVPLYVQAGDPYSNWYLSVLIINFTDQITFKAENSLSTMKYCVPSPNITSFRSTRYPSIKTHPTILAYQL